MTTYHIAILRHVYQPDLQGDEQVTFATEPDSGHNDMITFDTPEEAHAEIAEWADDIYVTEHNESGRPTYAVVDDLTAEYVIGGRNGDMGNYDWDDNDCKRNDGECCGECDDCLSMMINQDRDYIIASAVK